jgi:mannan endo-1,4-beta-mannosidase
MWGTQPDSFLISGKYSYFLEERWGGDSSVSSDLMNTTVQPIARQLIQKHYRNGGFIGIMVDMYVNGGNPTSATEILPGGAKRTNYLATVDTVLNYINSLTDDNGNLIPVLYRPFLENDGSWFWWGAGGSANFSVQDYIDVWQDHYDYIVNTKGVHNLIFVYSPDWGVLYGTAAEDRYPGDAYVDVIGIDQYKDTATLAMSYYQEASDFATTHSKVFSITEGLRKLDTNPMADFWTTGLINPILADSKASKAAYFNIWRGGNKGAWEYGPKVGRSDETSFLTMSQNPKIKMLQYYNTRLGQGTYGNMTIN